VSESVVEHVGPDGEVSRLPAGERVLWRGAPDRRSLARYFFRERWVLGFVLLTFLLQALDVSRRDFPMQRLLGVAILNGVLALIALASIRFFAARLEKTSGYVITDRRVYFNIGVVLRADANVPYAEVDGVDLRRRSDGSGDLMISLAGSKEIPWLLLFPHLTWRGSRKGRPTFRALREPQVAADAVVGALREYARTAGIDSTVLAPAAVTPSGPIPTAAIAAPSPA
jgi:Bacterial PH domain